MVDDHRTDSGDANQSNVNILDCFRSSENIKADREASSIITQRFYNELTDVFTGIRCFKGTF